MRVNGQIVLLLTLFALRFSLGDQVPHTNYLNLIDWLFIIGTGAVFSNFISTIVLADAFLQNRDTSYLYRLETRIDRLIPATTFLMVCGVFYFMI